MIYQENIILLNRKPIIVSHASDLSLHKNSFNIKQSGQFANAEGNDTKASGNNSHAEGGYTQAIGISSHAEGNYTQATGYSSHAEGYHTTAYEEISHAEGKETLAGYRAHAEGYGAVAGYGDIYVITAEDQTNSTFTLDTIENLAVNDKVYVVGYELKPTETTILAINNLVVTVDMSIGTTYWYYLVKFKNDFSGIATAHAEGFLTIALGNNAHAEGYHTVALGSQSHAEGYRSEAIGSYSHAEGHEASATGQQSHTEGSQTKAQGSCSHAEGYKTEASGDFSHAEGNYTLASGYSSHAEGINSVVNGYVSHAEGYKTEASGTVSHAEGYNTKTSGFSSHAEGYFTTASGKYSHAQNTNTTAQGYAQTVIGQYNVPQGTADQVIDTDSVFIIGNGTAWDTKSNAMTVSWKGDLKVAGEVEDGQGNKVSAIKDEIGNLTDLLTIAKGSIVNAINDIYDTHATHLAETAQKHIKESGNNANGYYIRFDDGTQICWHIVTGTNINISTASGSLYESSSIQWIFPASFIDAPKYVHSNILGSSKRLLSHAVNVTPIEYSFVILSTGNSIIQSLSALSMAIGRWK